MQFEKIKLVIDQWDPIGLLASSAPPNEYDLESRAICAAAADDNSPEELATLIQQIFTRYFDESLSPSYESCLVAARKILDVQK